MCIMSYMVYCTFLGLYAAHSQVFYICYDSFSISQMMDKGIFEFHNDIMWSILMVFTRFQQFCGIFIFLKL